MSCLVIPTYFDQVFIEPKNKIVVANNDTFCVHDIIFSYANDTCPKRQFLNIVEKSCRRVIKKQAYMLKCGQKMHLMSGGNFGVLTPKNPLYIWQKMNKL